MLTDIIQTAGRTANRIKSRMDEYALFAENNLESKEDQEGLCAFFRRVSLDYYRLALECLGPELNEQEKEKVFSESLLPIDQVKAILGEDAIYIRTPMLLGRQTKQEIKSSGQKDVMFADSVRYAILNAHNYADYDFCKFREKTISYLYVYESSYARRGYMADSDNHEVKFVTDAITEFLPEGDSPVSCSFYHSTEVSDRIERGTYITVTTRADGLRKESDILSFWEMNQCMNS